MENFAEILRQFQKIRAEKGEAAFEEAVRELAEKMVDGGGGAVTGLAGAALEEFAKEAAAYKEAAAHRAAAQNVKASQFNSPGPEMDEGFMRALQASMPGLRSQAQFNAFMAAFEALRGTMQAIFSRNTTAETEFRGALGKSLEAARQVTDITERLSDVPDAAESKLADEFKNPPRQFGEYDLQRALLGELTAIGALDDLSVWWVSNRQRIDQVVSLSLRNPLIDAVREKKQQLSQKGAQP